MEENPQKSSNPNHSEEHKSHIWDCGSSLYDSFELNSFKRHLDSAITTRTLSMPRFSDYPAHPYLRSTSKKPSKISRSFHRLIRSVFRLKPRNKSVFQEPSREKFCLVHDQTARFSTVLDIPVMVPEKGRVSPEFILKKSRSERFPVTSISISYA